MPCVKDAIQITQEAIDATPNDHPDRAMQLYNLATKVRDRYSRIGAIADLEKAIQLTQEAVDLTSNDHPHRAAYLDNLGAALEDRYLRTGEMADLEQSIQLTREAIDAKTNDDTDRVVFLNNLGVRLSNRYSGTGAISDLEEAIQIARAALNMAPNDYPNRAMLLSNLGVRIQHRYSSTSTMADLEEAVRTTRESVNITPDSQSKLGLLLNNLGARINYRSSRVEATNDLDQIITDLGGALDDLKKAIPCNQSALDQLNSPIIDRLKAGRLTMDSYALLLDWQQAYEASAKTVPLIPKLSSRSLENSDKQHMLSQVTGLASDAAAVALKSGKGPLVALDFLEQGRGVLAASLEEMRTDILDLRERYPEQAKQFDRLRYELNLPAASNTSSEDENHDSSWQSRASVRHHAGIKLDEVIAQIRQLPGFEDFLLAPSEGAMRDAARNGPIAVINVSKYRCDAILVEHHQTTTLALPNLTSVDILDKAQRGGLGSPKVLEWLWDVVAKPVLDALEFTQIPVDDKWLRLWWVPTGHLTKFPLHAAGRHYIGSTETVLDRVMSSYSSSIRAIIHGRSRRDLELTPPPAPVQALLVAMQNTPKHNKLPFARKEVAMLHNLYKGMTIVPIEPKRHKHDVVSHLSSCKIFHFAGHGSTHPVDPSQSCLLLEDWESKPLTVGTLLEMNLREGAPFLAYLSACGTGQIRDQKFADESIHLISACQLAGFRHVIGTLWEVNDDLCVDMAKITYEGMRDGGMTDHSVCGGLHLATRELRDRWLSMPGNARRGNRSARKIDTPLVGDKMEIRSTSNVDQRDYQSARDIASCDDEDDVKSLLWVPYVHFGV